MQDRINVAQITEERIQQEIDVVMESLSGNKAVNILNNEVFDSIYSVLFYLGDVPISIRKDIIQILEQGLKNLTTHMQKARVLDFAE